MQRYQRHKIQSSRQYLLALLGSAHVKAACKHVDEIDPCFQNEEKIDTPLSLPDKIDCISIFLSIASFAIFNICYWTVYY